MMNRRQAIALVGGATAWPLAARAQQGERVWRVGVTVPFAEDDPEGKARIASFQQALHQLGWVIGRNMQIDTRWAAGNAEDVRRNVAELIAFRPDLILATGSGIVGPLVQATRTTPIVFVNVADPVGGGFVDSLARPGGNVTGFTAFEYGMSGKWLELLKQIAPTVTRAAVIRDPSITGSTAQFAAIQAMAPLLGAEVRPVNTRNADEIERGLMEFARSPNGGLIVTGGQTGFQRSLIITLAAQHRLPAVYPFRYHVASGGLTSYGPDTLDQYRRAASYVDRILKGEKPADLPVQAPTKYLLTINLKTARALGLEVPPTLLARADEVIE
jgi:ABC-type uncharacterized transport system substrate-binding protein